MEPASRDPRTRVLYDLAREFAAQLELDQLLPLITSKCLEFLDAEGVAVLLLDPERRELYFPYASQVDPEVAAKLARTRFAADRGIAGPGREERLADAARAPYSRVDTRSGSTTQPTIPDSSPEWTARPGSLPDRSSPRP